MYIPLSRTPYRNTEPVLCTCRRLVKATLRTIVVLIIRPLVLFVVTGAFISLIRQLPSLMYEMYAFLW